MPRKQPHPNFVDYVHFIADHENYRGMPDLFKDDGEIQWETPSNRLSGKFKDSHHKRLMWWRDKAIEIGIDPTSSKWISRTAKHIHPTQKKPCSVCGNVMVLNYSYPTLLLLRRIRNLYYYDDTFLLDPNQHILELIINLYQAYGKRALDSLPALLQTSKIEIPNIENSLENWLEWVSQYYVPLESHLLSPGAMSNAPDRLDGFHTYNRCCRSGEDKGRSSLNLASYVTDRRVFEYWNQGDWIAADRLMGQVRSLLRGENCLNGHPGPCSADHIGPLSLGFDHRPEFQLLCNSCNSGKNNRMMLSDVVHLRNVEDTGAKVISWHSKALWDLRKQDVTDEETALRLSKLLRDNRHNVLNIFQKLAESGHFTFLATFLELEYAENDVVFEGLHVENHITKFERMIHTPRNSSYSTEQKARRCRIAYQSLLEYFKIETRNVFLINSTEVDTIIANALSSLADSPSTIKSLDTEIQRTLASDLTSDIDNRFREIVDRIPHPGSEPNNFFKAKQEILLAFNVIANHLSERWDDDRYTRSHFSRP